MRLPRPWTIHHNDDAYWIEAANGKRFAHCYFREHQAIGSAANPAFLTRGAAERAVSFIARMAAEFEE